MRLPHIVARGASLVDLSGAESVADRGVLVSDRKRARPFSLGTLALTLTLSPGEREQRWMPCESSDAGWYAF